MAQARNPAILRMTTDTLRLGVSVRMDGFVSSLTSSQWIDTGYALAITRLVKRNATNGY
jgi:hypothetical protein